MAAGSSGKQLPSSIAVTGGLGSGKSFAATFLTRLSGGEYIDVDQICLKLMEPGAKGWQAFRKVLGCDYFSTDGVLNRPLLRKAIFQDGALRVRVNQLLHPLAREVVLARLRGRRSNSSPLFIVEVPLLFEARWEKDFDKIVVVYSESRVCCERVMKRDGAAVREAEAALAVQWPISEKALRGDYVIDNSGAPANTQLQLMHLARIIFLRPAII